MLYCPRAYFTRRLRRLHKQSKCCLLYCTATVTPFRLVYFPKLTTNSTASELGRLLGSITFICMIPAYTSPENMISAGATDTPLIVTKRGCTALGKDGP